MLHCLVAVCCSVLQCVAVCCSVLHCVAVCCSVLCGEWRVPLSQVLPRGTRVAVSSSVLQWVAVGCSGLQCDTSKCGQRCVILIRVCAVVPSASSRYACCREF